MTKKAALLVSLLLFLVSFTAIAALPGSLDSADPDSYLSLNHEDPSLSGNASGLLNRLLRGKPSIKHLLNTQTPVQAVAAGNRVPPASFPPSYPSKAHVYQRINVYRL
jgi:hypothetical protein